MLEIGDKAFLSADQSEDEVDQARHSEGADDQLVFRIDGDLIRALVCEDCTIQAVKDEEDEAEHPEFSVAREKAFALLFADEKDRNDDDGDEEPSEGLQTCAVGIRDEGGDQDAARKHQRHLDGVRTAFGCLDHGKVVHGKDDAVGNTHGNDLPIPMKRRREEREAKRGSGC